MNDIILKTYEFTLNYGCYISIPVILFAILSEMDIIRKNEKATKVLVFSTILSLIAGVFFQATYTVADKTCFVETQKSVDSETFIREQLKNQQEGIAIAKSLGANNIEELLKKEADLQKRLARVQTTIIEYLVVSSNYSNYTVLDQNRNVKTNFQFSTSLIGLINTEFKTCSSEIVSIAQQKGLIVAQK